MFNVQSQKYFPVAVHMINGGGYYKAQYKGSTVQEYYEKLKNNMEVLEQLGTPLGVDHGIVNHILTEDGQSISGLQPEAIIKDTDAAIGLYPANEFLLGYYCSQLGKLIKKLQNYFSMGVEKYPDTLQEAYHLLQQSKFDARK